MPRCAARRNLRAIEHRVELLRVSAVAVAQRLHDHLATSCKDRVVELELAHAPRSALDHAWREQLQYPSHIGCGDEVKCAPHWPCANDRAPGDRALDGVSRRARPAHPDGPQRGAVILCLDRNQLRNDFDRARATRALDLLIREPRGHSVAAVHEGNVRTLWSRRCARWLRRSASTPWRVQR